MSDDPCTPTTVTGSDGATITACLQGGHVMGWTPAAGGPDRLWMSPLARCGPGQALRGGIPVIFPQFSTRGPLPKHGILRDRAWRPAGGDEPAEEGAAWSAEIGSDAETRAIWPAEFSVALHAVAAGPELELRLVVRNTGGAPWTFMAALHGYLALGSPEATISGLGGREAENNAADRAPVRLDPDPLLAIVARDVAVHDVPGPVRVDDPRFGPLELEAAGFPDRVVWNPGAGHGIGDVPDGAERGFVCVEAAALDPVELPPAASWTGRQVLRAL